MVKKKIELNNEQQLIFESFKRGANIFLTGKGGSGKSFLTRQIIDWCKTKGKEVLVCAPTGIAAINIQGATIHRTFGCPIGIIEKGKRCYNKRKLEVLSKADAVVIDEISMCRIDIFEYVANTLLYLRPRPQILVVGDPWQLPPVLTEQDAATFNQLYPNKIFAFESELWERLQLQTMELQTSMRQNDKEFVTALDNIREGKNDFSVFPIGKPADPTALTICGTNKEADYSNQSHLKQLKKDGAKIVKIRAKIEGTVEKSEKPTDEILELCEGAKVVMLNNDTDNGSWVNGSFATVANVTEDSLSVRLEGKEGRYEIKRNKWTAFDYDTQKDKDGNIKLIQVERGSFEQFPVRLAWAITIHKSQGQTYDRVNINVENIFAEGQLYVALSRCKSLDGIRIIGTLTANKVKTSKAVMRFMNGNTKPGLSGKEIPFYENEGIEQNNDRYQEGYDTGYHDGTEDTEARYKTRIANDPSVKILSAYTTREKEKEGLPPELRNPRNAGRKKHTINELHPSKAIRVPGEIADTLKAVGDLCKEYPSSIPLIVSHIRTILENIRK